MSLRNNCSDTKKKILRNLYQNIVEEDKQKLK